MASIKFTFGLILTLTSALSTTTSWAQSVGSSGRPGSNGMSVICVNGQCFSCNGTLAVSNGRATCNGRPISRSEDRTDIIDTGCGIGISTHRHTNPDGSSGGVVADGVRISESAYIDNRAKVCDDDSTISDNTVLAGNVYISGEAHIGSENLIAGGDGSGQVLRISGRLGTASRVSVVGPHHLSGLITMEAGSMITGAAHISGRIEMQRRSFIVGTPHISGSVKMSERSFINGAPHISASADLGRRAAIIGDADISENLVLRAGQRM